MKETPDISLISVVIPVYNAERFVRQACESALDQPEVGEVILVEDGSPDDSLAVCKTLSGENERVRLLWHPNGANRGAGCSRNLGIKAARYAWIAFLDADDVYLKGRFDFFNRVISEHPDAEGVCEAVGVMFENQESEKNWNRGFLDTLHQRYSPSELFSKQAPVGNGGFCCTPGWTVKKSALERCGMFPEHLRVHQDTALYVKLAAKAIVYPGEIEKPVAMRRVHAQNRISAVEISPWWQRAKAKSLFWSDVCNWAEVNMDIASVKLLYRRFFEDIESLSFADKRVGDWVLRYSVGLRNLAFLPFVYPKVLCRLHYYRYLAKKVCECFGFVYKRLVRF